MSRCSRAAAVAIMATMAACTLDPPAESAIPAGTQVQALNSPCQSWGCGANSPVVDTQFLFHDMCTYANGLMGPTTVPNDVGLGIVAAGNHAQTVQRGIPYDLTVEDGRFVGRNPWFGTLQGPALRGAMITLTLNGPAPRYAIVIDTVRTIPDFVGAGSVEVYTLLWQDLAGGPATNLCGNVPLLEDLIAQEGDDSYTRQELMGMHADEALIFEGDRIDAQAKTMSPEADDKWFNFGCAGHLLAKLRLTQNTIHSQATGLAQAWQRRQATMKMYAADYCGGGTPFTVAGQRLVWQGDLMRYMDRPRKIEARWIESGATCIYEPRMAKPTSKLGANTFPDIKTSIADACRLARRSLPSCAATTLNPYDDDGRFRVSANP